MHADIPEKYRKDIQMRKITWEPPRRRAPHVMHRTMKARGKRT